MRRYADTIRGQDKQARAWWLADEGEAHKRVFPSVWAIETMLNPQLLRFWEQEYIYDNDPITNRRGPMSGRAGGRGRRSRGSTFENLVAQNVDTLAANITDTDVSIRIQTDGADWFHQQQAKQIQHYANGLVKLLEVLPACQRSYKYGALLKGLGAVKVATDRFDQIQVTPVAPDNILVDTLACANQKPKALHYRDFYDREELAAQFPDHAKEIMRAQTFEGPYGPWRRWGGWRTLERNEVVVVESWRLPSGPKGHEHYIPGLHTICVHGADILYEEYDDPFYPFEFARFNDPVYGFYGRSLTERILPHQALLDQRNYQVNASLARKADPITYVHISDVDLGVTTVNQIGAIAYYRGVKPETVDHQAVGQETYNSLDAIRAQAQRETGMNEMMMNGAPPPYAQTGEAVRQARLTHGQRFSVQEDGYERLILGTTMRVMHACKKLGAKAPDITRVSKYGAHKISWADLKMDDLKIEMSVASAASGTAAGRQQLASELAQMGAIDLDEYREMLQLPDIDAKLSLYNASAENIEWWIWRVENGETGLMPSPTQNLKMFMSMVTREINRIEPWSPPEEIIEALSNALSVVGKWLNPPPPPMLGAPGMPPGPGPGPMPPGMPPPGAMPMPAPGPATSAFAPGALQPIAG
jgi:hypothetical protein